jgi:hypothetical protein
MLAWVLNLDADRELAHPKGFQPRAADVRRAAALVPLLGDLIGDDRVIAIGAPEGSARGLEGRAWCPTPWALERMRQVGAEVPGAPSLQILQRVNHRAFCSEIGPTLPGARYCRDADEALALMREPTPSGSWLVKHPHSFSGSGQLPVYTDRLTEGERVRIERTIGKGGAQIEPRVEREGDYVIHGEVTADGALRIGQPVRQEVDERGQWQGSFVAEPDALSVEERRSLIDEARRVAEALRRAGYFGPFGVDAFRYRWWNDEIRFTPRCEINARYTMGWAQGMAAGHDA